MSESKLQISMVRWFRLQYPQYTLNLFHIPNGRMRSMREAKILKAEGVVAGVADLALMIPSREYHALFIEVKTEKGKQRASQKIFQKKVEEQGYRYEIVRNLDQFIKLVNEWLKN